MKPKSDRLLALQILNSLLSNQGSLSSQLNAASQDYPEANLALLRQYTYGMCRWYDQLDAMLVLLMDKPLRNKDRDIHCLILLGLYQLFHMRTPDHAVINETVSVTRELKKVWAGKLVNGVLRNAQRQRESLTAQVAKNPGTLYSHPPWLVTALQQDWVDHWESILANNNIQAPMTLRLNTRLCNRPDYLAQLAASDIVATAGKVTDTAVILETPVDVSLLPGFTEGLVSVQDEASQLVATLLNPTPGSRVLDACAAPGGKTCAILEKQAGNLDMSALDSNEERLQRVRENLQRLGLNASIVCADAARTDTWWDSDPFDSILLDAPCSGTGVIRRHPDIKLLRTQGDINRLGQIQQQLLNALWPCLKQGGRLLYSTCSVLKAENCQRVESFIASTPDARPVPVTHPEAIACSVGMQFLPGCEQLDGFYYALLEKD